MNKSKVLYVDDEEMNLKLFDVYFGNKFGVELARSAKEGIEILDRNPDVVGVISDMKMPDMNGIEFVNQAKKKHPNKDYYIVSGFEINTEMLNAIESGLILKYFRKPFSFRDIEDVVFKKEKM